MSSDDDDRDQDQDDRRCERIRVLEQGGKKLFQIYLPPKSTGNKSVVDLATGSSSHAAEIDSAGGAPSCSGKEGERQTEAVQNETDEYLESDQSHSDDSPRNLLFDDGTDQSNAQLSHRQKLDELFRLSQLLVQHCSKLAGDERCNAENVLPSSTSKAADKS